MLEFSWKTLWIFILLSIIIGVFGRLEDDSSGRWWSGADDQELDDERRDAQILKAVQDSMAHWEANKNKRSRQKRADPTICYGSLGCFSSSGPFSYLDTLPATPEDISTTFLLYPGRRATRSITLGASPLVEVPFNNMTDAFTWARQHFNTSKPTKVLVHGFGSSCHYVWVYEMRSALMSVDDFNIVCVDWEKGATLPNYVKAAANTRLVGKQLAMLLKGLEEVGLSRSSMHLIGFSLGAHVAGFAGTEMRNISRITGLDPAGPLFETQVTDARLDSSDATFVDVIHSNGENLFLGGLGSWQPMGHVDFYPNGGRMQKGCSNLFVGAVSDFIWSSDVEGRSLCNHRRAYKFFVDSVSTRCHFPAFPCESYDAFLEGRCFPCTGDRHCGNMGYYADKSTGRGQLFLITRDEEPFCAHQYSVKIESSSMSKPLVNYGKIKITLVGDSDLNETFTMTSKDDEQLIPGEIVSRILVPHPIISEPTKVQILYQGYSGWLSSGLRRWRIDKVSMMDSFGKTSSVCKKGLELDSGVPITLRLYAGDCNIPKDGQSIDGHQHPYVEDRISDSTELKNSTGEYPPGFEPIPPNKKFVPTPVIRIGNEAIKEGGIKTILQDEGFQKKDKNEVFVPWKTYGNENNNLDESSEIESTRSFNTKSVKLVRGDKTVDNSEVIKEIAEPVLRKPSNKNARAHDLSKPEITEPILGPTTVRTIATTNNPPNLISRLLGERELNYNFYENENNDWVPADKLTLTSDPKHFKRHDFIQTERTTIKNEDSNNPLKMIMMTVQFLPQRLSRMFEQAEKYARETIFPLITQHTPKFISNFISPQRPQPKYVPFNYEDPTTRKIPIPVKRIDKSEFTPPDIPVSLSRTDNESLEETSNSTSINLTTIEKIEPRANFISDTSTSEKVFVIYPETNKEKEEESMTTVRSREEKKTDIDFSKIPPNSKIFYDETSTLKLEKPPDKLSRKIYVDLPVIDEQDLGVKYIPLVYPDNLKPEKITRR